MLVDQVFKHSSYLYYYKNKPHCSLSSRRQWGGPSDWQLKTVEKRFQVHDSLTIIYESCSFFFCLFYLLFEIPSPPPLKVFVCNVTLHSQESALNLVQSFFFPVTFKLHLDIVKWLEVDAWHRVTAVATCPLQDQTGRNWTHIRAFTSWFQLCFLHSCFHLIHSHRDSVLKWSCIQISILI